MGFLFGSGPKTSTSTAPTINPLQAGLLSNLSQLLTSGQQPAGVQAYTGQFAAPQTAGQQQVVQQLLDTASGVGTGTGGATTLAQNLPALVQAASSFRAPQIASAPQINFNPQTPTIDPTAAFEQGVVKPVTSNFLQTVVPSLNAGAGRSAGGIYSSDLQGATDQALTNLNETLTGAGAQYALGAAQANQGAQLTTNQLLEQIAGANQGAQLSTNALNTASELQGQGLDLAALGLGPSAISSSYAPASNTAGILESLFPTISTPQQTEQTQLAGQYQDFLNQITQGMQLRQLLGSAGTTPTQQTNTTVTPAQQGLIPSLLSSFAANQGVGNALGSFLFS